MIRVLHGDCREFLKTLEPASVQCCVTSPPYYGLRDYGVDGQIGLEHSPDEYVAQMVEVFRGVRRVLRDDGTLWLNLGDCYSSGSGGDKNVGTVKQSDGFLQKAARRPQIGVKPKDLLGIPWSVAKAMQRPFYEGRIKSERDRAWLAAIIDGEGTICGFTHERADDGRIRTGANIFVTNSCDAMLEECHRIWPASRHEHMAAGEGHLGSKEVNRWIPQGAEQKSLLMAELYPYLISKKSQALVAWNLLQFVLDGKRLGKSIQANEVREKRALLASLLSDLNKGRPYVTPSWCIEPPNLEAPGWWLRSAVVWAKPNPMPESVTDRPTSAYEHVFLFAKAERYFYDAEAIAEPAIQPVGEPKLTAQHKRSALQDTSSSRLGTNQGSETRNARNVWTIATQPYSGAHFATMPPDLAERCIKAGTSEKGCCPCCGAPWERIVDRTPTKPGVTGGATPYDSNRPDGMTLRAGGFGGGSSITTGWAPSCSCPDHEPTPCVVLDPFGGAGTTGLVADRLNRNAVLIELNPEYAGLAKERIQGDAGMFADVA